MKIRTVDEAQQYIYSFIPKNTTQLYPGEAGLERMKHFLSLLGDPQNAIKTIHIAGTSGKGSTAYTLSSLLKAHGFTVGLIIKPHIDDIRERYQINNALISEKEFCQYLSSLVPAIEKMKTSSYGKPTYAELNTALAFYIFADKKVDYGVIETYLGGSLDCTNVIEREDKVAVITKLGFDHTKILGNTLSSIAAHKAGIIYTKNQVFSLRQKPKPMQVIRSTAKEKRANLEIIEPKKHFSNVRNHMNGVQLDFSYKNMTLKDVSVSLFGVYQAENISLALTAFLYLADRDRFKLDESKLRSTLRQLHFNGRGEIRKFRNKTIIMDGAHNPQKMKAFLSSLQQQYPDRKFDFLLAFMAGKDIERMIRLISPLANRITITEFFVEHQDWTRKAVSPQTVKEILEKIKFRNIEIVHDKKAAFTSALMHADDMLVITGSLYFVGELHATVVL